MEPAKRLKKTIGLPGVYAIATGATLSSGLFLLPGLAAAQAGPAAVLAYVIAAIPLVPATLSLIELSTAMPRAGGAYFFLDRSMGPLAGTIGGLGTWLALILKTAFALVGMGAYIRLFLPEIELLPIAIGFAVLFGVVNLIGAKGSASFQVLLVALLLVILTVFLSLGVLQVDLRNFQGFLDAGGDRIAATAGMVYISYIGITKVASVSEEVRDPERNLPLGMLLAFGTAMIVYVGGVFVMVGLVPMDELAGSFTPMADAAAKLAGRTGMAIVTIGALFAFASVANAGILSASRYPLAMSRDHLFPSIFRKLNARHNPSIAIYTTVAIIVVILLAMDPTGIAKLASTFQLLMFAMLCGSVIVMRESRLESYDPGFKSPGYPWVHILGILSAMWSILEMGWGPILFSLGLAAIGSGWYFYYARSRVERHGAIFHTFARLGKMRSGALDRELRGALKQRGVFEEDMYDMVVGRAHVVDLNGTADFETVARIAAIALAERISADVDQLIRGFMEGTRVGATPVAHGAALPHLRLPGISSSEMVVVCAKEGVRIEVDPELAPDRLPHTAVQALFFLVSPADKPGQHLRMLAQIAACVDSPDFMKRWIETEDIIELKAILLRDDRFISLHLRADSKASHLAGRAVKDLELPQGSLIVSIHRDGINLVPQGDTLLSERDRLTIIGDPVAIRELHLQYSGKADTYLASIVASSQYAIYSIDVSGRISSWNPASEELFGYSSKDMLGNKVDVLLPDDRRDEHQSHLEALRRGERIDGVETSRLTREGRLVDVLLSFSPIEAEGHYIGASVIARDISERKRTERASRYLAAIVEGSEDAIITKDFKGRITSWNPAAERMYGYSAEEAVGKNLDIIVPGEKMDEFRGLLDAVRKGKRVSHFETVRVARDGRKLAVSLTLSPIEEKGRIVGASAIARDITPRAESARTWRRLGALIASANDAIIGLDHEGKVTTWNPAAEALYGYTTPEMTGATTGMLATSSHSQTNNDNIATVLAGETVPRFTTVHVSRDGRHLPVSVTLSPILEKDRVTGALMIVRPV